MLLGIDYGDKRVGLALAEERGLALPWKILDNGSLEKLISELKQIISEQNITLIIVGWPINMSGARTERTEITDQFVKSLQSAVEIKVVTEDERWSSKPVPGSQTAGPSDDKSAAHILQSYIDHANAVVE